MIYIELRSKRLISDKQMIHTHNQCKTSWLGTIVIYNIFIFLKWPATWNWKIFDNFWQIYIDIIIQNCGRFLWQVGKVSRNTIYLLYITYWLYVLTAWNLRKLHWRNKYLENLSVSGLDHVLKSSFNQGFLPIQRKNHCDCNL